jgi:hypothetical protein
LQFKSARKKEKSLSATNDNLFSGITDIARWPFLFATSPTAHLVAAIANGRPGCRQAFITIAIKGCADMVVILSRADREQASISSAIGVKQRRRYIDRLTRGIKIVAGERGPRIGVASLRKDIEPLATRGYTRWARVGRTIIASAVLRSLQASRCNSAYLREKATLDQFDTRAARSRSTLPRWARSEGKGSAKASLDDKNGRQ